jgi:hypothetical protein
MKAIWNILILLVLCSVLVPFGPDPRAQNPYICKVHQAGPAGANSTVRIRLSDTASNPEFTNRWFRALTGREKEMLAVALAAISSGYEVEANVNLTNSLITAIHLRSP